MFYKLVFRKRPRTKCIWKRICQIHQIRWIKYKYKYKYMAWNLIKYKYKYKYAVFVFVFVFANTNTYLTPALFLAAGHNNYTKSCRLYLQGCQRSLCQCLQQQFNNGLFTIYNQCQGAVSIRKTVLPGMAIPMLKIRRPNGRLIFNMEIAIRR